MLKKQEKERECEKKGQEKNLEKRKGTEITRLERMRVGGERGKKDGGGGGGRNNT